MAGQGRLIGIGLLAFLALSILQPPEALSQEQTDPVPPLRTEEPLARILADLEIFIPRRMEQESVPGLSIALVRDRKIVWKKGFGVANTFSARPVTPQTVFEVASNSKVVTAYLALRLAELGQLALDEPVRGQLYEPWLPSSVFGDRVTVRHLASHSSGLTDNLFPLDKTVGFEPGSAFLYSGVGFLYLQAAIEQIAGESLEAAARRLVFEPLGMSSSSFVNSDEVRSRLANGHMSYMLPLLGILLPFVVLSLAVTTVLRVGRRMAKGTWKAGPILTWSGLAGSLVMTLAILVFLLGRALPHLVVMAFVCGSVYVGCVIAWYLVGRGLARRLIQHEVFRQVLTSVWVVAGVLGLLWIGGRISGPVVTWPSPSPSAVGSLRTTAGDLALMLLEVSNPEHLGPELGAQLREPQIAIGERFSWGFGIGIQHSSQGNALWQNGMTFGYRSVMVMYPEQGIGVVVQTNSQQGLPLAYEVAHRAVGGAAHWMVF